MTHARKNNLEPISKKSFLNDEYANKYDIYGEIVDAFELRAKSDDFTQDTLAKLLGVNKGVVSRRLNGSANITIKTLGNMATALRCRLLVKLQPYEDVSPRNYQSEYHGINSKFPETGAIAQWSATGTDNYKQITN
jgi:transcriptional regulator with XRE-family HTH domain